MNRRLFLTLLPLVAVPQKRGLKKIVEAISAGDKAYNEMQARIVKRGQNFAPETDPAIKGWARQEAELSHKVGDLWEEFAELGE